MENWFIIKASNPDFWGSKHFDMNSEVEIKVKFILNFDQIAISNLIWRLLFFVVIIAVFISLSLQLGMNKVQQVIENNSTISTTSQKMVSLTDHASYRECQ